MADFMSPQFLPVFIEEYRRHRCLWLVTSKEYSNKHLKAAAYKELIEVVKQVVSDCNANFIKKKIDLLRGNFRREHKKVKASIRTGSGANEVHTPKLWYYNLLLFLTDQEEAKQSTSSLDPKPPSPSPDTTPALEEDEELNGSMTNIENSTPQTPTAPYGRKRKCTDDNKTSALLEKAVSFLENKEDEYDRFAGNIAAKLRKMDGTQSIFAENLINQVLFNGLLGKLNEHWFLQPVSPFATPSVRSVGSAASEEYL